MDTTDATRRFHKVLFPALAVFLTASLLLAWAGRTGVANIWLLLASIVPVTALAVPYFAMWRLVHDLDEFLRLLQVQALMAGAAAALLVASSWGYLEAYADVPAMPVIWLNPIFWVTYGLASFIVHRRAGVAL